MSLFEFGWPWIGLGGGIVILIILFCTNTMRNDLNRSRWWDPTWLTWLAVPVYLLHQFEEYALHMDIDTGTFEIIETVFEVQNTSIGGSIPLSHFPVVNIGLVWVAVPIAAILSKKNPAVGIAYYGFILVNGLMHVVQPIIMGGNLIQDPGGITGAFLFIPTTVWIIIVCVKSDFMTTKGLVISLLAGVIAHIGLGGSYVLAGVGGAPAIIIADIIVVFLPILIVLPLSKVMNINKHPELTA